MGCVSSVEPDHEKEIFSTFEEHRRYLDNRRPRAPRGGSRSDNAKSKKIPDDPVEIVKELLRLSENLYAENEIQQRADKLFRTRMLTCKEYASIVIIFKLFQQDFYDNTAAEFKTHFGPIIDAINKLGELRIGDKLYPTMDDNFLRNLPAPPQH
jgi:hypothetical protein